MKRFRRLSFIASGLVFLLAGCMIGSAGPLPSGWLDVDGFRGLPWGSSIHSAKAVFPDMAFVKYSITKPDETPATVFNRKEEDRNIDGTRFDEILYWFRDDVFRGVTATLGSKVGPRTLRTPASDGFDRLKEKIDRFAGPPVEDRTQREPWGGNRKGVWRRGGLSIELTLLDPPGINGEELVLRIFSATASRGRAQE